MKKILLSTLGAVLLSTAMTGCVATPPGQSVASLGMGSDSAAINAGRGRADAQITDAQARQYAMQRNNVRGEMDLEQQKRENTINNTRGILQGIGDVVRIFR